MPHLFAHKLAAPPFLSLAANIVEIVGILLNRFFAFPIGSNLTDFFFNILYFFFDLRYFKDNQLKMDGINHFQSLFFKFFDILMILSF